MLHFIVIRITVAVTQILILVTNVYGENGTGTSGHEGFSAYHLADDDIPGEPLSPLDFQNAEKLSPTSPTSDPTEKAGYFEGDVIMIEEEDNSVKNAIKNGNGKWKNGTIPYLISSKFNEHDRSVIARAVLEFQRQTCISFTPRDTEVDCIMITTGDGCHSQVGRVGGVQRVTLGDGCLYPGIVMHELMHAVGFWHEQSRWDRDEFVIVHFENIQPGMEENFRKKSWQEIQNLSAPYDTYSIMHYGAYAFSKNSQKRLKTISPKVTNDKMGQRQNFSETDVYKINKLYNCNKESAGDEYDATTQSPNASSNPPENAQHVCKDNHYNCEKWANNGECQKNPNWMLVNCKQSCKQCRTSCSNNNKHCETWANNGECSKNPGYMKAHCAKACHQC